MARRVDDAVGDLAHVRHRLALGADRVEHVALAAERMAPPALVVAAHERLVARLEEEHFDGVAAALQLVRAHRAGARGTRLRARRRRAPRAATSLPRPRDEVGERRDQRGGQVVDAEEAHVLEALDGVALPRPAQPGDDDEARPESATGLSACAASERRWCDGRMPSSSRYFATVRRAMVSPRPLRICATS